MGPKATAALNDGLIPQEINGQKVLGVGVDPETKSILVDLKDSDTILGTAASTNTSARAEVERILMEWPGLPDLDVVIRESEDAGPASDHPGDAILGGVNLSTCTAAFTVKHNGAEGLLTAAHCSKYGISNRPGYIGGGHYTGTGVPMSKQWGPNADMQAIRIPSDDFTKPRYYNGRSNFSVPQPRPGAAMKGNIVGHLGKTTGFSYGYVDTTQYKPLWDACNGRTCNASFVRVQATQYLGDSGGPWFTLSQNVPLGVHHGGEIIGDKPGGWSVYSALRFLPTGTTVQY